MNTGGVPAAGLRLDDRYRLVKQVGSGGMSVVFDAHDEVLQRQVAVKMLAPNLSTDPALSRRLLLEARAVAGLRHPNITTVFDFGVHRADDGTLIPYLVMEMLDGELLSDVLHLGRMPWREAVGICAQLAAALAAAHAAGIVHHDITPANIMLTSTGVKVLDFGISAVVGDTQHGVDGEIVGTASYLAPERLARGHVSAYADVYAAGLVLYRCLAGRLPWAAGTVAEMLHAHAHVQPRRLPPLGLPHAIEDACYQCLAREPRHRPSAAELTRILSRQTDRSTTTTIRISQSPPHPSTGDGQTRPIDPLRPRRHLRSRRILAGAAALCSILVLGYLLYPTGPSRPRAVWAQAQTDTTSAAPCSITYSTDHTKDQQFDVALTITNTGPNPIKTWTLQFALPVGESIVDSHRADTMQLADTQQIRALQQGQQVTLTGTSALAPGIPLWLTLTGRGNENTTRSPAGFALNGQRCDATLTLLQRMRTAAQPPDTTMTVAQPTPKRTLPGSPKPKTPRGGKHSLSQPNT
jgi:serine/threonine-protein kinase